MALVPHPTKNADPANLPFLDMDFNTKMPYDQFAKKVGEAIGVEGTHLRFYTVNANTGNPKLPVKRLGSNSANLVSILFPSGSYGALNMNQKNDMLYYEVLDMTLTELETKKSISITWLSEGVSKEVSMINRAIQINRNSCSKLLTSLQEKFDVLVSKAGTVEDLVQALIKKAGLKSEEEAGQIRVYEANNYRFFKDLPRSYQVVAMNDYTTVIAERIPEEEFNTTAGQLIPVYHFHNEPSRPHGVPFKFLALEGEKFSDTKQRLEKRTGFKGRSFEKIKFAVVRRSHYSKAHYLKDGKCPSS